MTTRKHDTHPGEGHPERRQGGEGDDHLGATTPEWLLERIALARAADAADASEDGDASGGAADPLAPHDRDAALARLAADPDGEARLAAIARSNDEILAAHPPARVAAEIERRLHLARTASRARDEAGALSGWRTHWARWGLPAAGAAACAAALAVVIVTSGGGDQVAIRDLPDHHTRDAAATTFPPDPDTTRVKGVTTEPRLTVYRHHERRRDGGDSEVLSDGAEARAGDLLQLAYAARGHRYGVIVSIDGRGAVTLHFPENPDAEPALSPDGHALLAHAYELDDAPAFERFVLVASREPIAVHEVIRAAEAVASRLADSADPGASRARHEPLALPDSAIQHSTLVRKVDTHAP